MSTKVVKLNQAEQMMTYLEIDKEGRRILVRFADREEGWVPVEDIEDAGSPVQLNPEEVTLPNPYEIEIGTSDNDTIKVPWDFARHYCDSDYKEKELEQKEQGRSMLGERVARIRESQGITQEELARRAELGRVTISRLENGEQSPRYRTLEKIARALGIEVSRFLSNK